MGLGEPAAPLLIYDVDPPRYLMVDAVRERVMQCGASGMPFVDVHGYLPLPALLAWVTGIAEAPGAVSTIVSTCSTWGFLWSGSRLYRLLRRIDGPARLYPVNRHWCTGEQLARWVREVAACG
jgi:hypothetical protein